MRKAWLAVLVLMAAGLVRAQTGVLPVYWCSLSGTQASVSGLKSSNYQLGIIPSCTVSIYLTGTTSIATTTPQSPFTANTDGSIPPISAPLGIGYDVCMSGGIAPNTYPIGHPNCLVGLSPGGSSGGGGCVDVLSQQSCLQPPVIYDLFQHADSTALNGQNMESGNSTWGCTGPNPTDAVIMGGRLLNQNSSGNWYCYFPNTASLGGTPQPVVSYGATFYVCPSVGSGPYDPSLIEGTIMATQTAGSLNNMLHLVFSASGWSLYKFVGGVITPGIQKGSYHVLPTDCTSPRQIGMVINTAAGTVQVIPPDGDLPPLLHDSDITTIAPTAGMVQINYLETNNGPGIQFGKVWMGGPSLADRLSAQGLAPSASDVSALFGTYGTYSYQTSGNAPVLIPASSGSPGWYAIAKGASLSTFWIDTQWDITATNTVSSQHLNFFARESNGATPQIVQGNNTYTGIIDQVRLSNDGAGNLQLEIHLTSAAETSGPTAIWLNGKGIFTPVVNLSVGSTPYPNASTVSTFISPSSRAGMATTTTGNAGWETIAWNDTGVAQGPLTARFLMTANDGTNLQTIDLEVSCEALGSGAGKCVIGHADSPGTAGGMLPIDAVRVSSLLPSGATCTIAASGGVVTAAACSGGTNYAVTNPDGTPERLVLTQAGCTNAQLLITSVSGGAVTGVSVFTTSSGCTSASGVTTYTSGTIQLDVDQPSGRPVTLTASNGVQIGSFIVNPNPTANAVALNNPQTVQLGERVHATANAQVVRYQDAGVGDSADYEMDFYSADGGTEFGSFVFGADGHLGIGGASGEYAGIGVCSFFGNTNPQVCVQGDNVGVTPLPLFAQGFGDITTESDAPANAVPVKIDTANPKEVKSTTTTDTGAGVVVGVCDYQGASPGVGTPCPIYTSGYVPDLILGTGTCAAGQFVIVDTTTAGRVQCTSTYTAGTVIGKALAAQGTVGQYVQTFVGLR